MSIKHFSFILAATALITVSGTTFGDESFEVMLEELGNFSNETYFSSEKSERKISGWATYKQTYGKEDIQIKFPKVPRIKKEKNLVFTYAQKRGVQYTLVTSVPPIHGMNPKQAFSLALASLDQDPNLLIDYKTSKQDKKFYLDMTSQNYRSETMTKTRMVVTPNNFYILRTVYPEDRNQDHKTFVDSFSVK